MVKVVVEFNVLDGHVLYFGQRLEAFVNQVNEENFSPISTKKVVESFRYEEIEES